MSKEVISAVKRAIIPSKTDIAMKVYGAVSPTDGQNFSLALSNHMERVSLAAAAFGLGCLAGSLVSPPSAPVLGSVGLGMLTISGVTGSASTALSLWGRSGDIWGRSRDIWEIAKDAWDKPSRDYENHKNYLSYLSESSLARHAYDKAFFKGGTYEDAYQIARSMGCNLSQREFFNTLRSNGLVSSFDAIHPDCKVGSTNSYRGEIGGVAVEVGQIQLFQNTPAHSLFNDLFLCLPYAVDTGELPFSKKELRQVLAELTEVVLMDQSNPFFSLHFSEDGRLYPIIHPAYQNTLVGYVVGMLDYYMKGYLNGGFYSEEFIRDWHKTENMDKDYLFQNVQDLKQYAKQHKLSYVSLRELMYRFGLSEAHENKSNDQVEYKSRFQTSFRIIAKQDGIQAKDNFLLGNPSFDVRYSIDLMPHYQEYVGDYVARHGVQPEEYQKLQHAYALMAIEIKENMPKMPFIQKYFNMLDVISFFCYVLHSLKNRGQVPVINQNFKRKTYTFPNSLPPYPARYYQFFPVKITLGDVIRRLDQNAVDEINALIKEAYLNPSPHIWDRLLRLVEPIIFRNLIKQLPKNSIEDELVEQINGLFLLLVKKMVARNKVLQGKLTTLLKKITKSDRDLSILSDHEIEKMCQSLMEGDDEDDPFFKLNKKEVSNFISELRELYVSYEKMSKKSMRKATKEIDGFFENQSREQRRLLEQEKREILNNLSPQVRFSSRGSLILNRLEEEIEKIMLQNEQQKSEAKIKMFSLTKKECDQILRKAKSELLGKIKQSLLEKQNNFLETLNGQAVLFDNSRMPISTLEIPDRHFLQAEGRDTKIIGGCGVDLTCVYLTPLRLELEQYQSVMRKVSTLSSETMMRSEFDNKPYYTFKLDIADHLSKEPHHYEHTIKSLLPITATEDEESVISDLLKGNEVRDRRGITDKTVNRHGQTVFHYAALCADSNQAKRFFGVSSLVESTYDQAGYNAFHTAIVIGNLAVVKELLRLNKHFANQSTQKRYTPLMLACMHGHTKIVSLLLLNGSNPNIFLMDGSSALMLAIQNNKEASALCLLNKASQLDVNKALVNGQTPLHEALEMNQPDVVSKLLSKGARTSSARHHDGFTPFHCAAFCGRDDQILLFLNLEPDLIHSRIDSGETALHLAVKVGQLPTVELLLNQGADANSLDKQDNPPLFIAIKKGYRKIANILLPLTQLTLKNQEGDSALSLAAKLGDFSLCDSLIEAGVSLKQHEKEQGSVDGMPLSFYLIVRGEYQRYKKYVNQGWIPVDQLNSLGLAARYQQPKIYHFLMQYGKKFKWKHSLSDVLRNTILVDDLRALKRSIKSEKDLYRTIMSEDGETLPLLHFAAKCASTACLAYLVERIDTNQLNSEPHPLVIAIKSQRTDIVDIVLRLVEDINAPITKNRDMVLHLAIKSGDLLLVEHLYARGAKASLANQEGITPWHLAIFADDHKMFKLLARLYRSEALPSDIYVYALENDAKACLEQLEKMSISKDLSQERLRDLCFSAVEQKNFDLLARFMPYGYPEAKKNNTSLIELSVINDDPLIFDMLLAKLADSFNLSSLLDLAVKYQSFRIIARLHKLNFIAPNLSEKSINKNPNMNSWLRLALLNDEASLLKKQKAIINAIEEVEIEEFKGLIKDLPINRYYFSYDGVDRPLLHIAILKDSEWTIKLLKKQKCDPLLLDSKGYGIACRISFNQEILIQKLELIHRHFPQQFTRILTQVSEEVSLLDRMASYGFKGVLPKLLLNSLSTVGRQLLDKDHRCLLHKAAEFNNFELLNLGIDSGLSIDAIDRKGLTPLMIASCKGHESFVQALLHKGANPNKKDCKQRLALHYAVVSKNLATTFKLLSVTKDINASDRDGQTILLLAAQQGNETMIAHLLMHRIQLDHRNRKGLSALHLAVMHGKLEVVFLLVMAGHPIDLPYYRPDKSNKTTGCTPLHLAAQLKKTEIVIALLSLGASLTQKDESGNMFIQYAVMANDPIIDDVIFNLNMLEDEALQAELLLAVAQSDNLRLLRYLLSLGHSLNVTDKNGRTPLHMALLYRKQDMVATLLKHGANPSLPNVLGEQAIHVAARVGELSFIRELAKEEYSVDFSAVNQEGETPLHIAAKLGHQGCVIELLRLGKTKKLLMSCDRKNQTPIHNALFNNHWHMAELLLLHLSIDEFELLISDPFFIKIPAVQSHWNKIKLLEETLGERKRLNQPRIASAKKLHNEYAEYLFRKDDLKSNSVGLKNLFTERRVYQSDTQRNNVSEEQKDNQKKTSFNIQQGKSLNNLELKKPNSSKQQVRNLTDRRESQQDMNVLRSRLLSEITPSSDEPVEIQNDQDLLSEDVNSGSNFRSKLSFFKEKLSDENSRDIKSRNANQPDIKRRGLDNTSKKEKNRFNHQFSVQKTPPIRINPFTEKSGHQSNTQRNNVSEEQEDNQKKTSFVTSRNFSNLFS